MRRTNWHRGISDALIEMMQKLMSFCPGSTVLYWDNLFLKHKLDNTAQKNATLIYASSRSAVLEWKFVKLSCSQCSLSKNHCILRMDCGLMLGMSVVESLPDSDSNEFLLGVWVNLWTNLTRLLPYPPAELYIGA
jgi:hypothetical protein